jgi:hypothetical protein
VVWGDNIVWATNVVSFLRHDRHLDQVLWSILDREWLRAKAVWGPRVRVR